MRFRSFVPPLAWLIGGLAVGAAPLVLAGIDPFRSVVTAHGGLDSMVQTGYLAHALHHLPWTRGFWDLPIFWPTPYATVMMDPTLVPALLLRLVWWQAGHNPALDVNLLFLLTLAGSFWACAAWGRREGLSSSASALAGLVYALGPFAVGHWQHLNQLPSPWLPLALLACAHLAGDAERPGRWSALWALALVLQLLSSVYLFASVVVASTVALAVRFPAHRRARWTLALAVLAVGLATAVWSVPFTEATHVVEGYRRVAAETGPFQARLFDLQFAPQSHLLPWPKHVMTRPALYPGLLWGAGAIVGIWLLWRASRRTAVLLGVLAAVGMILAVGRSHPVPGGAELPMPFAALQDLLPPLRALRDPSRFFVLTHLAMALLGAYAWQRARRVSRWSAVWLVLALVDLAPGRAESVRVMPTAADREVLAWLSAQPKPAVWSFASLPCTEPQETLRDARATLWAALTDIPTVGGSAGIVPPAVSDFRREFCRASADRLVEGLQGRGVRYLISDHELRFRGMPAPPEALRNRSWVVYSLDGGDE